MVKTILKYSIALSIVAFTIEYATQDTSLVDKTWLLSGATLFIILGFLIGKSYKGTLQSRYRQGMYLSRLSPREGEVAQLILKHYSNKEICSTLCIEQSTLKTHINKIYHKCEAVSRKEFKERLSAL